MMFTALRHPSDVINPDNQNKDISYLVYFQIITTMRSLIVSSLFLGVALAVGKGGKSNHLGIEYGLHLG